MVSEENFPEAAVKLDYSDSAMAYNILSRLQSGEAQDENFEGYYSRQIAEEVPHTQKSISNMLSKMEKDNLVYRSKRDKAQYYRIDLEGLESLLVQTWEVVGEAQRLALNDIADEFNHDYSIEGHIDLEMGEDTSAIIRAYFRNYLSGIDDSTIQKMIVADFKSFVYAWKTLDEEETDLSGVKKFIGFINIADPMFSLACHVRSDIESGK